jgi:hypothetical protein
VTPVSEKRNREILNPNFEFRNKFKFQNPKLSVLEIGILDIRACFGFRASYFGFKKAKDDPLHRRKAIEERGR